MTIYIAELKRKIEEMESKYDAQFTIVFEAIKQLIEAKENQAKNRFSSQGGGCSLFQAKQEERRLRGSS